ncbi:MAG: TetR/AcrR family transcriptional regulator [Halanaeroarchaeum sp.]
MVAPDEFLEAPSDTREEILAATYRALCEHGYASLTVQRIADEFPKSKSLLYHHYEGKDDLLLDFLSFMLDRFEETVPDADADEPAEALASLVNRVLAVPLPEDRREFSEAMVELRAQAAHDPRFRDHFTNSDALFRARIASIVRRGVETGAFREVDPEAMATLLVATLTGTMTQRVTGEEDVAPAVREELSRFVREYLRA